MLVLVEKIVGFLCFGYERWDETGRLGIALLLLFSAFAFFFLILAECFALLKFLIIFFFITITKK